MFGAQLGWHSRPTWVDCFCGGGVEEEYRFGGLLAEVGGWLGGMRAID